MARMIDPSNLEGDDLVNWYVRSPAEVEVERQAARQEEYDAFFDSIGGGSATPGAASEDEAADLQTRQGTDSPREGGAGPDDSSGGLTRVRYFRPMTITAPPVMTPPTGPMVGPQTDVQGMAPVGASPSSFFGQHRFNTAIGGYSTDLPSPLNRVTPGTPSGSWWELGDGSRAPADEVNRIYGEQKRRMQGQDHVPPAVGLRSVNRWQDGQIPRADQVAKNERELDPTCHPNGGWERDPQFDGYSQRTKRYEVQIARAPGLDYVVRNPGQAAVRFDGCATWEPQHRLLEAKGPGYAH